MLLTKKQKNEMVIKLREENKTTRDIAEILHMSPRDIGIVLRKYNRDPEPKQPKSKRAKAFQMFSEGKKPIEVAIKLDLDYDQTMQLYSDFLKMEEKAALVRLCEENEPYLPLVGEIIKHFKEGRIDKADMSIIARYIYDKKGLDQEIQNLEHQKACLTLEIQGLNGEFSDGRIPGLHDRDQVY